MGFEEECFYYAPDSSHNGTFNSDYAKGLCEEQGKAGYERLMKDATCNKNTKENSNTGYLDYWYGRSKGFLKYWYDQNEKKQQQQKVKVKCGKTTAKKKCCIEAKIEVPDLKYNVALVLDTSQSTLLDFQGGKQTPDHNNDGTKDTILDTEIAASLGLLESMCGKGELGNNEVMIGLISFSVSLPRPNVYFIVGLAHMTGHLTDSCVFTF